MYCFPNTFIYKVSLATPATLQIVYPSILESRYQNENVNNLCTSWPVCLSHWPCNRGPRIKKKNRGLRCVRNIYIPLCFDGDRERSRVDPLNFTDDPVIGQSRVICIASIRWDCCWQGMEICRWSVCQNTCGFLSLSLFSHKRFIGPL